jgi:ATP-dependent DNA helicase RecG
MEDGAAEDFEYQSVEVLKGVGQAVAEKLKRLEIYNIQDVLFHLPLRYEDRTKITALGSLQIGQQALIEGVIDHSEVKYGGRGRRSLLCYLSDNTGAIVLRFFHFNKQQQNNLSKGQRLRCFGEARRGATRLEIVHPEYHVVRQTGEEIEQSLTPIYPKTEGVHQTLLKKISDQVLSQTSQGQLIDWLPEQVMEQYQFPDLASALAEVHRPDKHANVFVLNQCKTRAQQRLLFEELLAHQLSLLQARHQIKQTAAKKLSISEADYQ